MRRTAETGKSEQQVHIDKLQSEIKVLSSKIEKMGSDFSDKLTEKDEEMEFVKEQAKKHVTFIIKQQKDQ